MITHSCDVCGKDSEPGLQEVNAMRSVPMGWFRRHGRVRHKKDLLEIQVLCCSEGCCKRYDKAEAEEIGFSWAQYRPNEAGDIDLTKIVKPLKA